jgi:hypothetical protein
MRVSGLLRRTVILLSTGLSSVANSTTLLSAWILSQASQVFSGGKPVASVEMTGTIDYNCYYLTEGLPLCASIKYGRR